MRNTFIIARRELAGYFVSPVAYIVAAAILAVQGFLFYLLLTLTREATMRYSFSNLIGLLFIIGVVPFLTMRSLAEEKRMGTIELLLTSPVRDWEVVVGKFLAGLGLWAVILILSLYFPAILFLFGEPDPGAIAAGYLGLFLLGGALLAIGLFASALTQSQLVAGILGAANAIVLALVQFLGDFTGVVAAEVLEYLGLLTHYFDFVKGIVDTKEIIYYLSIIAAFLFLATRALETRRWK